jgi:hypothetical protein
MQAGRVRVGRTMALSRSLSLSLALYLSRNMLSLSLSRSLMSGRTDFGSLIATFVVERGALNIFDLQENAHLIFSIYRKTTK